MFGKSRRERRITKVALEAQAEWAALSEVDKRPLRDAFESSTAAATRDGAVLVARGRAARAASVVRNLPARVSRTPAAESPEAVHDTMVVSSAQAWLLYRRAAAFVCDADRAFRPVRFVAFDVDGELQREVPRVIAIRDRVPFTSAEQRRLMTSGTELDLRLADVIAIARRLGLDGATHQVYLLTAPCQSGHVSLPAVEAWRGPLRRLLSSWSSTGAPDAPVGRLQLSR
jgi:hypothetical protein